MDWRALAESVRHHGPPAPPFSLAGQVLPGLVVSCYDGDTLHVVLPVFGHFFRFPVRLDGIDTPEMKSKIAENKLRAIRARNRVLQLAGLAVDMDEAYSKKDVEAMLARTRPVVVVECKEFDKYGRLLANVRAQHGLPTFSEILLADKLAYTYGGATKLTENEQADALEG